MEFNIEGRQTSEITVVFLPL